MSSRITREDCEHRLAAVARLLKLPLLNGDNPPGNALYIEGYTPGDRYGTRCRVATKDGRTPFGSNYCLGYRELFEKLDYASVVLVVEAHLGDGGFSDYRQGF